MYETFTAFSDLYLSLASDEFTAKTQIVFPRWTARDLKTHVFLKCLIEGLNYIFCRRIRCLMRFTRSLF